MIGNIYYDSGLSKDIFNKIYIATLKKYFSTVNADEDNAILSSIRAALRKRRSIYFPDGVKAEDVHSNKDVWTFVVFLSGLIIYSKTNDVSSFLTKLLDKKVLKWLKDKGAESTLHCINDADSPNINILTIRRFYDLKDAVSELENEVFESVPNEESVVAVTDNVEKLTNKEVGKLFLIWVFDHAVNKGEVSFIDGDYCLVKSPLAFIEFSKIDKHAWKSVQKGALKLGLHEANIDNGTPFHKLKGANIMKYETAVKEVLLN